MPRPEKERRDFVRVPFKTEVSVRTADRTLWANRTLDMSLKGSRIATAEQPSAEETACEIKIVLSDASPLQSSKVGDAMSVRRPASSPSARPSSTSTAMTTLRNIIRNNAADPDRAEREFDAHRGIRKPA